MSDLTEFVDYVNNESYDAEKIEWLNEWFTEWAEIHGDYSFDEELAFLGGH